MLRLKTVEMMKNKIHAKKRMTCTEKKSNDNHTIYIVNNKLNMND